LNNEKKYKIYRIIIQGLALALFLALAVFLIIKFFPIFQNLSDNEEARNSFVEDIRGYGVFSFFIIIGLQIFQTILMIIPSGPIVMISGLLFKPFVAFLACIIGQTIGCIIVYLLVKLLGYKFIALFIDPKKITESRLLGNETRTKVLMFGYYLIPALPKDIIAFVAPFTKVKLLSFGIITLLGRMPMTLVTVFMGASLFEGNYILAIILGGISLLLAILCFIFNNKIVNFLEMRKNEHNV